MWIKPSVAGRASTIEIKREPLGGSQRLQHHQEHETD
jgi:hypothetical protein